MNNEEKKTTTFRRFLRGLLIAGLVVGTGIAIYDHREKIGKVCSNMKNKIFTKKDANVKSNSGYSYNNSRRNYNKQ